jgi:hypothetical protein
MAYAVNPKTVMRLSAGAFHDATGGPYFQQSPGNPAFRFDRVIRFTDMNSYMAGSSANAVPDTVTGAIRTDQKRPVSYKFSAAVQRDVGWHTVVDIAYVGDRTRDIALDYNYNPVPAGARFQAQNRDLTVPDSATTGLDPTKPIPGALPDMFLRPIVGFGNINISSPIGTARYDSLQTQVSRRFTGRFEMSGSYTWSRGYASGTIDCSGTGNTPCTAGNPTRVRTPTLTPLPAGADETRLNIQEHVVVVSYQVDIPAASHAIPGRVTRWILDNWRISGITTLATGGFREHHRDLHGQLRLHRRRRTLRRDAGGAAVSRLRRSKPSGERAHRGPLVRHERVPEADGARRSRQQLRQREGHAAGLQQPRPVAFQGLPDEPQPEDAVPRGGLQSVQPHTVRGCEHCGAIRRHG